MSDTEINIAIAEVCRPKLFVIRKPLRAPFDLYRPNANGYTNSMAEAWKVTEDVARKYVTGPAYENEPDKVVMEPAPEPDYCRDLNAMHGAEMMAFRSIAAMERYRTTLHSVLAGNFAVELDFCAPAKWRAEAFLRTIGKWRDA